MMEYLEAGKKLAPDHEGWNKWQEKVEGFRVNLAGILTGSRRMAELDEAERIWPGFPGVEAKRKLLREKARKLRKVKFAGLAVVLVLALILGLVGNARMQRNRRVRVALNEARTAQMESDWAGMLAAAERALAVDGGNQQAESLRREAEEGARNAQVNQALAEARAAQSAQDWQGMLAAAERALSVDRSNQDALGLKREAERNLPPVLEVRALLNGRPVPATLTEGGRTHTMPARIRLEGVQAFAGTIQYESGGRRYTADPLSLRVNWRGVETRELVLYEIQGPRPEQVWRVPDMGLEMMWIPAGEFRMGSTAAERAWASGREGQGEADWFRTETNPSPVRIHRGFWMGRTTVTVAMFRRFVEATGHRTDAERAGKVFTLTSEGAWGDVAGKSWRDPGLPGYRIADNHPVVAVSWNDAMAFCRWLTETERAAGRLPDGYEYRLPGEAEWEYAARGGRQGTRFWWGDSVADAKGRANVAGTDRFPDGTGRTWTANWGFSDGFAFLSPVDHYGARGRNGFGLADMLGNVWEWCYDAETGRAQSRIAKGDAGSRRVLRGGSFNDLPGNLRCAHRGWRAPPVAFAIYGFRVVLGEIVR